MIDSLKTLFSNKAQLKNQIKELVGINNVLREKLKIKTKPILKKLTALEQNKLYYIKVSSPEEAHSIRELINDISDSIPWTLPNIFISNCELSELPKSKLRELIKKK